jgi:cytosine/adenosine deaminase-related metal-dependent hydrolase
VTTFVADWVLPIAQRPLRRASLTIADGRITRIAAGETSDAVDLGHAAILPALVNAHTHLELSYLHGQIPAAPSFGQWVRAVMATRRQYPDAADRRIIEPARAAIAQARRCGTGLVGDISNTLVTPALLREAGMPAQVFYELTGFTEPDPTGRVREARERADLASEGEVRVDVAPHAPYSVSAGLFTAMREDLDRHPSGRSSVHLGENPEEVELLRSGSGAIRAVLEELGRWPADWQPPGGSPVEYLRDLGFLGPRTLVVHGVQFSGDDLTALRDLGVTLVSCPRSNVYVGVGSPPLEAFYAMDVEVALGTDSLASAPDLDMFAELGEARRIAPKVPAQRLLESATVVGARALGFGGNFGTLEPGKRASALVVRVPEEVVDVEEYLVSGVPPAAVSWLADSPSMIR